MARNAATRSLRSAFTLVEILIVVVILGILAAVVIPSFANATEPTRQAAFVTNMQDFAEAAQLHRIRNGEFPPDSNSGELPDGFEELIDPRDWIGTTPIGGVWDTEDVGDDYGVGIHFDGTGETRDEEYMTQIDEIFDDGDLAAGLFQSAGEGRYYLILIRN
ncbi:MAG: type II secretion system protein [Phycisphaera sp.]|nr:MAG: type II secretion system protein [Phycisphaera sp.]